MKLFMVSISKSSIGCVNPGYVPRKSVSFMIWSEPVISVATLNASGFSFFNSTNAGWRNKFPPNNILLPILCLSNSFANSVLVKGADGLIDILNPNQEQSE